MSNRTYFIRQRFPLFIVFLLLFLVILTIIFVNMVNNHFSPAFSTIKTQPFQTKVTSSVPSSSPSIQTKPQLSSADKLAKSRILSLLSAQNTSGTLYQNSDIIIEYIPAGDLFQVEIDTSNVSLAKEEAVSWFKQHGVSQQGICDYPVNFYLNSQLLQQFREENISFNPLPDGC